MTWWSRDSFSRGGALTGIRVKWNKESCVQNMEGTVLWGRGRLSPGAHGKAPVTVTP